MYNDLDEYNNTSKQSRNWLATVINPATPIGDPNTANQLDDLGLYSFDPTFTPPLYEPADFDYDKTFNDVATNTYGRPYTPSDLVLPHRASSNDDDFPPNPMPSSGPTPVGPPVAPAQAPDMKPEMKKRGRGRPKGSKRVNKQHKEEKENIPLSKKDKKEKPFKYTPATCHALTAAVYTIGPFSATHGNVLKSWEIILSNVKHLESFKGAKVPAIRTLMDQLLEWHHDPDSSDTTRLIEKAFKGKPEEITLGALLDKISESRQTAEGRTEEQKAKNAKKDEYDKQGGDTLRCNSMKSMRSPDSPRRPTSPRYYVPPEKSTDVINVDASDADTDRSVSPSRRSSRRSASPSRGSSPQVETELPVSNKGKRSAMSRGNSRRHKRSKSFKDDSLLDLLLAAVREGQDQQHRAQKLLEKKLVEGVEKTNEVIREQTNQYVAIFKDIATAIKK
ncbi:hypothetical protein DFH08DRAFT_817698 [Mycena albidolilacea]|uniref:Uncharacterized protein n=1 Tax=Mycena albidolilacea TaxID=1033008 RepID=A0AAD6ZI28_9AGAR|nr:hypothetical protein DFH08DRAFT_817698 [Mycena albidolilacea]